MDGRPADAASPRSDDCIAIICAYCEEGRVGRVVKTALESGLFSRVLVVDDASTDGTAAEARGCGAEVISHPQNQGKAQAMRTGINASSEALICFLDSDLLGVNTRHLSDMVEPVRSGAVAATLGVFKGGRALTSLAQAVSPMISGQRCIRRETLAGFDGWDSGYGIETAINSHLLSAGIQQRIVYWQGAAQVMKEEKWGFRKGAATRARMYWQILLAWLRSKLRR